MSNSNQKPKINFNYQSNQVPNAIPNQIPQVQVCPPSQEFSQNIQICPMQNQGIQIQQYQMNNCFSGMGGSSNGGSIRLLNKKEEDDKKVVAVIVSFVSGGTYDNLFTSVEQKSAEGTKVQVYSCDSGYISQLLKAVKGQNIDNQDLKQLINQMKQLDSDCVVFNWECSSGYGSENFPQGNEVVFEFIKWALDHGHMTMFSDFSLKALISTWKPELLGPNPFVKISETSSPFTIRFRSEDLRQCPSAQLQIVGEMAEGGKCHVEAMGGTIVYSVDSHAPKTQAYNLQILTVVENNHIAQNHWKCKVGDLVGSAGHVLLTFKSGGHMLTSMGHWIELMKIDTSEKKLFEVAEKQYGFEYAQQMKMQYDQLGQAQQSAYISKNAVNFVQNQAPCSNMSYKTKKF